MSILHDILRDGMQKLGHPTVQSAKLDAQLLLCHVLGVERAMLYAYPERVMTLREEEQYFGLIERRRRHEPVAYLLGQKEFYGLEFFVDRRVLIPRPETELLVERALAIIADRLENGIMPIMADIGTGSGALPITIAVQEPRLLYIYANDISSAALEVASLNCQRHQVIERVKLLQGDLVSSLPEPVDLLIANLPYVGTEEIPDLEPDVYLYEPRQALFSGPDGLDLLRRLAQEVRRLDMLKSAGMLLLEIGYQQREALTQLLHELWPKATITCQQDHAGFDRLILMKT